MVRGTTPVRRRAVGRLNGALDVRAPRITEEMKMAAARAIADIVAGDELREDYIIPSVFNREVAPAVAAPESQSAEAPALPPPA